jgi:PTS system mannose-specific IIA component
MPDDARGVTVGVGVVLVGHGDSATRLLAAARGICAQGLDDLVAVDAGAGQTPELERRLCDGIEAADRGRGVLLMVDLLGSSPCACGIREGDGHELLTLSGLNLAMLLKLASLDRASLDLAELAEACAESGRRAIVVTEGRS